MNGVKIEDDVNVKQEAESTAPTAFMDDDEDEDTGELQIPNPLNGIYLTWVPKMLWDSWASINEDEEIQVGLVRVWSPVGSERKMKLLLDPDIPKHKSVPKEYDLAVTNMQATNTFVFAEKDLPGYRPQAFGRAKADLLNASGTRSSNTGLPNRVQKFRGARYKRSIPKQTKLAGRVDHELKCTPTQNHEYQMLMNQWAEEQNRPKHTTNILQKDPGLQVLNSGGKFGNFLKTTSLVKQSRGQDNKTARIPQNELLDLLHRCFQEYKYWSLKALKARVRQPEAYLKETLLKIATLVKTGTFAMNYTLNPEAQMATYEGRDDIPEEIAPDGGDVGDEAVDGEGADDDNDEENVVMEDVL